MNTTKDFIPDYVLIGHITHDITPQGPQLGGPVSYGAVTAAAFGLRVGIVTSSKLDEPLLKQFPPAVQIMSAPAEQTTTFENHYRDGMRTQFLYHRARSLTPDMLPDTWRKAPLAHLAPVAYEVDPGFVTVFDQARICITPQGWLRQRDPDGRVRAAQWTTAASVLPRSVITVLSHEDIQHDPNLESSLAALAPLLIITRARQGGTVYQHNKASHFAAHPVKEQVNPTGAGDIFAAALHIALARLGNLDRALRVAVYVAGRSVTRSGSDSVPTPDEITHAWRIANDSVG